LCDVGKRSSVDRVNRVSKAPTPRHAQNGDYFTKQDPERAMRRIIRQANLLGLTVRFDPIPDVA